MRALTLTLILILILISRQFGQVFHDAGFMTSADLLLHLDDRALD
jgi:hypothetical protein